MHQQLKLLYHLNSNAELVVNWSSVRLIQCNYILFSYVYFAPVLIGIGMTVHFEFRQFMHVAIAAIKEVFNEPKDVFWTGNVIASG